MQDAENSDSGELPSGHAFEWAWVLKHDASSASRAAQRERHDRGRLHGCAPKTQPGRCDITDTL